MKDMAYYIYDAHAKMFQLYRQLPEAMYVMQKHSVTSSGHNNADLHFPRGVPRDAQGEGEERPFIPHVCTDCSETRCREVMLERNEMYQRRRVMQYLRRTGLLQRAQPGMVFRPGTYYEMEGAFFPLSGEEQDCPEGCLWLCCNGSRVNPAAQLLCGKLDFCGELGENAWQEFFSMDDPLPLHGVTLCLRRGETLRGLPLFLTI